MLREIKETLIDYSMIGGTMAILTALINPFVDTKTTIRDMIISFVFSMLGGLLLEYIDIPYAVKVGLAGTAGFFAVQINAIICAALKKVEKNPGVLFKKNKSDK